MEQQSKREHWATILDQQRQSKLSIKQFCTEQNLSYQTFYYWSKKLTQPEPETKVQPIIVSEPIASTNCVDTQQWHSSRAADIAQPVTS